jgi:hypothetical protein
MVLDRRQPVHVDEVGPNVLLGFRYYLVAPGSPYQHAEQLGTRDVFRLKEAEDDQKGLG